MARPNCSTADVVNADAATTPVTVVEANGYNADPDTAELLLRY